jgi:hypothetical protein
MDINSTNTNKTNSHLLFLLNSLNTKKTTTYDVGNTGPGLGQAHKGGGVKPVNGIPTFLSSYLDLQWQYILVVFIKNINVDI